ncbi:MAG: biliverdin-producing heme oxygenase [Phenylobacterium sp.]
MVGNAHGRLRDATRAAPEALETRLGILDRLSDAGERRALVEGFHSFHADLEAAAAPWLSGLHGLEFEARRRTPHLERDLAHYGRSPSAVASGLAADGVAAALGLMYVAEGSTLGGQVIRRHVETSGGDMAGLSFLDPYGRETGPRWRGFLAVLNAVARTPAEIEAMVAGALAGFRHAELRLCGASADA